MNFALAILLGLLLTDAGQTSIEGQLIIEASKHAVLKTQGKDIALSSPDRDIAATFADARISGRRMKLVGKFRDDGVFEIKEFFVVRPDSLYRLIYYCDTWNIAAFSPGDCVCCQQPVEPIEVPLTDPRVRKEKIGPTPPKPWLA